MEAAGIATLSRRERRTVPSEKRTATGERQKSTPPPPKGKPWNPPVMDAIVDPKAITRGVLLFFWPSADNG